MSRGLIALLLILASMMPSAAQNARGIVDFFINQVENELAREERRRQERELRRAHEQERQRLYQALLPHWHACFNGDRAACDEALGFTILTHVDRQKLLDERAQLIAAEERRVAAEVERQRQEQVARAERERREMLQREHAAREREQQLLAELQQLRETKQHEQMRAASPAEPRPTSIWPAAFVIVLALSGAVLYRLHLHEGLGPLASRLMQLMALGALPAARAAEQSSSRETRVSTEHDHAIAAQALRLAHAYIAEVFAQIDADRDHPSRLADHRSTLALAVKQLDIAARADRTAHLHVETEDDTLVLSQATLRAMALTQEARTYLDEKPGLAKSLLLQATAADPEYVPALSTLGGLCLDLREKARAVSALEQAHLLAPDNDPIAMALDRARNMGAGERVAHAAGSAIERTASAAITGYKLLKAMVLLSFTAMVAFFFYLLAIGDHRGALLLWIAFMLFGALLGALRTLRYRLYWWWIT